MTTSVRSSIYSLGQNVDYTVFMGTRCLPLQFVYVVDPFFHYSIPLLNSEDYYYYNTTLIIQKSTRLALQVTAELVLIQIILLNALF